MRSHECSRQAFAPARSGMRGLLTFILATLTTPGFAANASFFQLCRVYHGDSEMETCDVVAAASFRELQDRADVIASTEPFSDAVDERCPRFTSHTPAHAPAAAAVGATLWRADSDDDLLWLDSEEALEEVVRPPRGGGVVALKWRHCFMNHSVATGPTFAGDALATCPDTVRVGITDAGSMLKVCDDAYRLTPGQRQKCALVRLPCLPHCNAASIIAAAENATCGSGTDEKRVTVSFDARSTDEKASGARGTQLIRLRDDDGARYFLKLNQRHWLVQQQIESLSIPPSDELGADSYYASTSSQAISRRLFGSQQDHYVNVPAYYEPRHNNVSSYEHARRIRQNILNEMDIMVSPNVDGPVNVSLYIHIFKVSDRDTYNSNMLHTYF